MSGTVAITSDNGRTWRVKETMYNLCIMNKYGYNNMFASVLAYTVKRNKSQRFECKHIEVNTIFTISNYDQDFYVSSITCNLDYSGNVPVTTCLTSHLTTLPSSPVAKREIII